MAGDSRTERLLEAMTLDEKVAQLGSVRVGDLLSDGEFSAAMADAVLGDGVGRVTRFGRESHLDPAALAAVADDLQTYLREETRLGVPAVIREESLCGYAGRRGTTYPQSIGMASTWDPDLVSRVTREIARELRAVGCTLTLSPVADLGRDPRWGRIEETYGEDPVLAARLVTAAVSGLQDGLPGAGAPAGDEAPGAPTDGAGRPVDGYGNGNGGEREGVLATLKHLVGHGRPEGGRNRAAVTASLRSLRDADLVPFRAAIADADAGSVMAAYHAVDGVPCHASRRLLTGIVREEWGFEGTVVSDGRGIELLCDDHGVAADRRAAGVAALRAGIDVELPETACFGDRLVAAVRAGLVDESVVDRSVRRVLREKARLGLFADSSVDPDAAPAAFGTARARSLARQAARRSIVLLQNEGDLLPLSREVREVAVVGPNADAPRNQLGNYAYAAAEDEDSGVAVVTPLEGIRAALPDADRVTHVRGCDVRPPEPGATADVAGARAVAGGGDENDEFDAAVAAARDADVAVVCVGGKSGIDVERESSGTAGEDLDRSELGLPGSQPALVRAVAATGTPTVVVLVNGRPLAVPDVADAVPAVVEAWLPGQEGGTAVADVLFGDENPGGRLPVSIPRSVGQLPVTYDRTPISARQGYVFEASDPLYPFGHGESYARFAYADLRIEPDEVPPTGSVAVAVDVTNERDRAGDEVVQLYARDPLASVVRPGRRLVGFRRVRIEARATATVTFDLPARALAFHDADGVPTLEPGRIELLVGRSSADVRLTGAFELVGDVTHPSTPPAFAGATVEHRQD
jgi:beta-glucosidase